MAFEAGETIRIPSPIDVHAHLREPGGTDKETVATGTYAALAGGYQAIFDMPNNPGGMQTWSEERLDEKYQIAEQSANINIGFYAGVDLASPNIDEIPRMIGKTAGLKLYFGHTTGTTEEYVLDHARDTIDEWVKHGILNALNPSSPSAYPPILLHAREGVGEEVARYIARKNYPVHWCHVSTASEANMAEDLRESFGKNFTAGVTPHHLTMTDRDADLKYGWVGGRMMPC
jgi:dihydroorotase